MKGPATSLAPKLESFMFVEAAEQLKESVRQGRPLDAAQVKVIGLDDIRRSAGESWAQIGSRVRNNSMHFLQGCLEPGDIVIPAGDGFLIIYASGPSRDLTKQSALLQDMLNAFYLGEQQTQDIHAKVDLIDGHELAALVGGQRATSTEVSSSHLVFHPVWNVEQQAIAIYCLGPASREKRVSPKDQAEQNFLKGDISLLETAIAAAASVFGSGLRCLISFSVHASTLKHRDRREEYLSVLRKIPDHLRPYLPARILDIEAGTPGITLAEWVHYLRPVALRVLLDLEESDAGLAGLDATGAYGVSCYLHGAHETPGDLRRAQTMINHWTPILKRQRLKLRVENIRNPKLLSHALACGVGAFASTAYWPPLSAPAGVRIFTHEQLRDAIVRIENRSQAR